jgi:hypothetical protein
VTRPYVCSEYPKLMLFVTNVVCKIARQYAVTCDLWQVVGMRDSSLTPREQSQMQESGRACRGAVEGGRRYELQEVKKMSRTAVMKTL